MRKLLIEAHTGKRANPRCMPLAQFEIGCLVNQTWSEMMPSTETPARTRGCPLTPRI